MNLRPILVLAIAAIAAPSLGGCKSKLDSKKLETAITDGMKSQGIPTKSVSCPADREAKKGDTFDCDAVTEAGDKVKIKIEQTDDQGNVNWKVDAPKKDDTKPAADKKDDDHKDEKKGDDDDHK